MQSELKKLAAILREASEKQSEEKLVKCAQIAQALIGLAFLQQKIHG
jgi:hypothetical protein